MDAMTIGRIVSDAREARHMTQMELSRRTGIAQSDISKLERGLLNPSIKILKRLAKGMDMQLQITFTDKEER